MEVLYSVGVLHALGLTGIGADPFANAMASQSLAALAQQGTLFAAF